MQSPETTILGGPDTLAPAATGPAEAATPDRVGATAAEPVTEALSADAPKPAAKKRGRPAGGSKKKRGRKTASRAALQRASKVAAKKLGRLPKKKRTKTEIAPKKRGRPPSLKAAIVPSTVPAKSTGGPGDGGGTNKRRAAVLKAVAEDLQRRGVAPSRPISLRMPEDLYKQVLAAMGEIGERSMSAFLIALTRDALGHSEG